MRAAADIDPRGAGLRAVNGRRVARDRHMQGVRPRHGRAGASANAVLNDAWSSRRRVEESPLDREAGAPTHAQRDGVAPRRDVVGEVRLNRALRATTGNALCMH